MMAPDQNPVNARAKSRIPTPRKSNKTGDQTKAEVKTTAEETATMAAQTRAVRVAPTLAKRGAQATAARIHRKADSARIADETDSVGKATGANNLAHQGVPAVETAATTTGNPDAEVRCVSRFGSFFFVRQGDNFLLGKRHCFLFLVFARANEQEDEGDEKEQQQDPHEGESTVNVRILRC